MSKKNKIIIFLLIASVLLLYLNSKISFKDRYFESKERDFIKPGGDSLVICTNDLVVQAGCSTTTYPTPIFHWACDKPEKVLDYEYTFILEVSEFPNFSLPIFNSGEVKTLNFFYQCNADVLESGKKYYWRVRVMNSSGTWSGWADSDKSFRTNLPCEKQ